MKKRKKSFERFTESSQEKTLGVWVIPQIAHCGVTLGQSCLLCCSAASHYTSKNALKSHPSSTFDTATGLGKTMLAHYSTLGTNREHNLVIFILTQILPDRTEKKEKERGGK